MIIFKDKIIILTATHCICYQRQSSNILKIDGILKVMCVNVRINTEEFFTAQLFMSVYLDIFC